MKTTKSAWIIVALLLLISLFGCKSNDPPPVAETEPQTAWLFAMDTVMQLTAYGGNAAEGLASAQAAILELESLVSVTDENSEIFRVNSGSVAPFAVSGITAELLETALAFCARTDGAMDVSIYPIVKAWGFTTDAYRVPSDAEIAALLPLVDYTAVDYDAAARTVRIPGGAQLDLGSIAKGYSGDLAIDAIKSVGVASALISLGGNVQTLGAKPDGSAWRVAVQNPEAPEDYAGVVEVVNKAVITSGGYERYFVGDDGEVYWHIMNPATGKPAKSGLISVTIIGESGALCDAMSTPLFVMGLDAAAGHWREYGDFEAVFITENHELYITEGLEGSFSPLGNYADTNVTVIRR